VKIFTIFLFLVPVLLPAQQHGYSGNMINDYFKTNRENLNDIEGVWKVVISGEIYNNDTLSETIDEQDTTIAIIENEQKYLSFNLSGQPFDVEFTGTDVNGVYLYSNFMPEINEHSKVQAVINNSGSLEFTFDYPEEYLKKTMGDKFSEGIRIVKTFKWEKLFPIN
jgi:hypothetical protein